MPDSTAAFFDQLGRRGHDPLLAKAKGTFRFEIEHGRHTEHWLLTLDRGAIAVSREDAPGDCSVRLKKALFERVIRGEANVMAALLRGEIDVEGNRETLVQIRRLFPGLPNARDHLPAAGYAKRQR